MSQPNKQPVENLFPAPYTPLASECLVLGIGMGSDSWVVLAPKVEWKRFLRKEQYHIDALAIFLLVPKMNPENPREPMITIMPLIDGVVGMHRIQMQNVPWYTSHIDENISKTIKDTAIERGIITGLSTVKSSLIVPSGV